MNVIKNEFPNPVLAKGRDDYIESCYFNTVVEEGDISDKNDEFTIPVKYSLKCVGLQKLVADGDAAVVMAAKSPAASYSRLFRFTGNSTELKIVIPKSKVVNTIEITGSVIAAQNIERFSCPGEFNDLYFGSDTFEIRKGDILATADTQKIPLDNSEYEKKQMYSVFNIREWDDTKPKNIFPIFDDEKITICLEKDQCKLYHALVDVNNGAFRRCVTCNVVYPVLTEAIARIVAHYQAEDNDIAENPDFSDKLWFRVIQKKSEALGVDLSNYTEPYTTLADRLLGGITSDALRNLKKSLESEVDSEETQTIGGLN